jgi:hypothetical protein
MFPAAMPKFKGDQKIYRNSAIFLTDFRHFFTMSFRIERSATFVQVDKALQQKISRYDALFTAAMRKSILRATSHFRNFTGCWEIFHNSVNFEAIFETSSPCCSEIKDLQLLCRLTTHHSRKFRDKMLCLRGAYSTPLGTEGN